ncbi:MAG: BCCT family transporter [Clostridiales bacterium]|uniref:BCCT family transporter n=1 Tax=Flavonifractor porci TaxID=3133422 RepID=UPI003094EF8D|nr:BCCT family transporter [Clostridiales bacterium]
MLKKATEGVNHKLLWPALILLVAITTISVIIPDEFVNFLMGIQKTSISYLGGTASLVSLLCVLTVLAIYFSPLGKVKLGGKDAKPMMNKWNWFAITLCTTIATGCVYWGIVQPILHVNEPPIMWGVEPNSPQAIVKTMSTIFLQWTAQPYGIYALPAIIFAFVYFNMKQPYGIVSTLVPVLGQNRCKRWFTAISSVLLFVNVCAMCASLAQGMFNLSGAAKYLMGWDTTTTLLISIGVLFVVPAIISSISGILSGIRMLSDLNMRLYFILVIFLICTTNVPYVLNLGIEGTGEFIHTYFQQSLATGVASGDTFFPDWINYNFAVWMSAICFAPVFMGSLCRGRTLREVIQVLFFGPVIFSIVWMTFLSGTAIYQDIATGHSLTEAMYNLGQNTLPYKLFDTLPWPQVSTGLYLIAIVISFVTYTDSSLTAMSTLACTHPGDEGDKVKENPIAGAFVKIVLGGVLIFLTSIMVSVANVDGARILANLSGWVCMIIEIILIIGAFRLMKNPEKYNYVENGVPDEEGKPTKKNKIDWKALFIPGYTK